MHQILKLEAFHQSHTRIPSGNEASAFEDFWKPYARGDGAGYGRRDLRLHQKHLLSQQQGQEPGRHGADALHGVRRRGAVGSRRLAAIARRGAQDGQRRGGGHLGQGGDARRYPRLPRVGPHRAYARR